MINAEIKELVDATLEEIVQELEEDRFTPSERGAGTAPSDSALEACEKLLDTLFQKATEIGHPVDMVQVREGRSVEALLIEIAAFSNAETVRSELDAFPEITVIDDFVTDNGESKYKYVTQVYEHEKTGRHIGVQIQECARTETELAITQVSEIKKQEVTITKWV